MVPERIYCAFGYECNNNCLFCAVDSENNRHTALSNQEIVQFFDLLKNKKDIEIEFSGGEPTARKEFFYFLENISVKYPEIRCVILSNGRNFSNINLAKKMGELYPFSVIIPLHGDTPELHDSITQSSGSFNETMLGIRNMYDYRATVGLKTVVTKMNYKCLPDIVKLVAQTFFDCPGITINGLDMVGKALINKDSMGMRLSDAVPYIEKAIDVANEYGLTIQLRTIPPCMLPKKYRKFAAKELRNSTIIKNPDTDLTRFKLKYGTIKKCEGCSYVSNCMGVWYSYLDIYGTEEINPIR